MLPTIRPAEPSDVAGILRLMRDLARETDDPESVIGEEVLTRDAFGPQSFLSVYVSPLGDRLAGFVITYPGYDPLHGTRGMHLADLYVDQDQRRHGIGRGLLAAAVEHCRRQGGLWMTWEAGIQNEGACSFYEAMGGHHCRTLSNMRLEGAAFEDLAAISV